MKWTKFPSFELPHKNEHFFNIQALRNSSIYSIKKKERNSGIYIYIYIICHSSKLDSLPMQKKTLRGTNARRDSFSCRDYQRRILDPQKANTLKQPSTISPYF